MKKKWEEAPWGINILTIISWLLIHLNPKKLLRKLNFLSQLLMGFHRDKQFAALNGPCEIEGGEEPALARQSQ